MKKVKTLVLRTAGTNCDIETQHAFSLAGSIAERTHINRLLSGEKNLSEYDILAIPGGFTYGDDIASGKILANEIKSLLAEEFTNFIKNGNLVIGICNGFQVLVKMGLLPNVTDSNALNVEATLQLNDSGTFTARWVHLRTGDNSHATNAKCIWTKGLDQVIYLPIAHAEGKFIPRDEFLLRSLHDNGQVVFQYCDEKGRFAGYPVNPNGSVDNIAGICDPTGRVLGMMPHPERHTSYLQYPNWRRKNNRAGSMASGLMLFKNGVDFVKNNKKKVCYDKK